MIQRGRYFSDVTFIYFDGFELLTIKVLDNYFWTIVVSGVNCNKVLTTIKLRNDKRIILAWCEKVSPQLLLDLVTFVKVDV